MERQIDLNSMTILIVDDVKSMRSIVRKMLKKLKIGGTLYDAPNGRDGLRILQKTHVDLAIIDMQMPIMNGAELLERIREDKRLRDMPVIMVTADSAKDVVLNAAEIAVEAYLLKPLTPAKLEEKIRAAVDGINNPDEATRYIKQARAQEEAGDLVGAIRNLRLALKSKPGASRLLRNIGLLYQRAGEYENAELFFKKAVSVNRRDIVTRKLMAEMYWEKKTYDLAVKWMLAVISKTGQFNERAIQMGGELLETHENALAIDIFGQIMSTVEKDLPLKMRIVDVCIRYRELGYAKRLLGWLIREFPGNTDLIYKAGVVAEAMGDTDTALGYYVKLDKYQVISIDVLLKIAKLYFHRNKIIQADDYLNKVLKRDPGNQEALALRQNF